MDCFIRRVVHGFLGASCLTGRVFSYGGGCAELHGARLLADAGMQGVCARIASDASHILLNSRMNLCELKAAMRAAGDSPDGARRAELLDLIGLVGATTLLVVGFVGTPAAMLILAGIALSSSHLIARGLTAPNARNQEEALALQTVGGCEKPFVTVGPPRPIATRFAANTTDTLIGGATTAGSFMVWLNSLSGTVVAEVEFDALRGEISSNETALAPLDYANAMVAVRIDAMTTLHGELSAFPCMVLD